MEDTLKNKQNNLAKKMADHVCIGILAHAVSYTHLDVYKRQILQRLNPGWICR